MQNNPKHERDINIEEKQPKKKRKIVERKSVGELIEVARSKARTGNFLSAIKYADSALKIEPKNAWVLSWRANFKSGTGDFEGAMKDADSALKIEPKKAWGLSVRANIKLDAGDFRGAMTDADSALEIEPKNARCLRILAEAKRAVQKETAAQAVVSPKPKPPLISAPAPASKMSLSFPPVSFAPSLPASVPPNAELKALNNQNDKTKLFSELFSLLKQQIKETWDLFSLRDKMLSLRGKMIELQSQLIVPPNAKSKTLNNQPEIKALSSRLFSFQQEELKKTEQILLLQRSMLKLQQQLIAAQSQWISPSADRDGESRPPLVSVQSVGMFASSSSSCSSSSPARDESGLATLSEVVAIKQEAVIARSV